MSSIQDAEDYVHSLDAAELVSFKRFSLRRFCHYDEFLGWHSTDFSKGRSLYCVLC